MLPARFSRAEILVLVGGAIAPAPAVLASISISATMNVFRTQFTRRCMCSARQAWRGGEPACVPLYNVVALLHVNRCHAVVTRRCAPSPIRIAPVERSRRLTFWHPISTALTLNLTARCMALFGQATKAGARSVRKLHVANNTACGACQHAAVPPPPRAPSRARPQHQEHLT